MSDKNRGEELNREPFLQRGQLRPDSSFRSVRTADETMATRLVIASAYQDELTRPAAAAVKKLFWDLREVSGLAVEERSPGHLIVESADGVPVQIKDGFLRIFRAWMGDYNADRLIFSVEYFAYEDDDVTDLLMEKERRKFAARSMSEVGNDYADDSGFSAILCSLNEATGVRYKFRTTDAAAEFQQKLAFHLDRIDFRIVKSGTSVLIETIDGRRLIDSEVMKLVNDGDSWINQSGDVGRGWMKGL